MNRETWLSSAGGTQFKGHGKCNPISTGEKKAPRERSRQSGAHSACRTVRCRQCRVAYPDISAAAAATASSLIWKGSLRSGASRELEDRTDPDAVVGEACRVDRLSAGVAHCVD